MFNGVVAARSHRAWQRANVMSCYWPHEMRPLQKADSHGAIQKRVLWRRCLMIVVFFNGKKYVSGENVTAGGDACSIRISHACGMGGP